MDFSPFIHNLLRICRGFSILFKKYIIMKRTALTLVAAAALLFACNDNKSGTTTGTNADSANKGSMADQTAAKKDAPPAAMPDSAAMAKAWQDFATPGPMHAWLAKTNGTWEAEVSQWMDPAAPPTKAKATNVQTSMLNGLYVTGKFTSTMMGMPFQGQSTMGYDNAKKDFVSTWVDNMGSGIVVMRGTYDEATKTLNLKGKQTDPVTGKDANIREEMKMVDDNTYTMAMYGDGMDGKEMKFMEGTFKRKK
jgi:Protein of unknown function (DUF1579)